MFDPSSALCAQQIGLQVRSLELTKNYIYEQVGEGQSFDLSVSSRGVISGVLTPAQSDPLTPCQCHPEV